MESIPSVPLQKLIVIAAIITAVITARLVQTALQTNNFEGLWFSIAHTVVVAVGVVWALRAGPHFS
jgi:hypothetical protein